MPLIEESGGIITSLPKSYSHNLRERALLPQEIVPQCLSRDNSFYDSLFPISDVVTPYLTIRKAACSDV